MADGSSRIRRIRYQVAVSLDGYLAGPNGEADWIVPEPTFDFTAHFAQFDAFLMGRATYQAMQRMGGGLDLEGPILVFSRTLKPTDHPAVEIVADHVAARLNALRAGPGKDIWLFGGGALFRSLLEIGQVDTLELAMIPILLGGGVPFLPPPAERHALRLTRHQDFPSGMLLLEYDVVHGAS